MAKKGKNVFEENPVERLKLLRQYKEDELKGEKDQRYISDLDLSIERLEKQLKYVNSNPKGYEVVE